MFELTLNKKLPKDIFDKVEKFSNGFLVKALVEFVHFDLCFGHIIKMDPNFEQFVYVILFELSERGVLK